MNGWVRKNLTLSVIITLLLGYGVGAAGGAVVISDVQKLKDQVLGVPEQLATQSADIANIKKQLDRIENYLMQ